MASRKGARPGFDSPLGGRKRSRADAQFDSWLVDRLHRVYDPVLEEPVPDDLLRLVESFDSTESEAADERKVGDEKVGDEKDGADDAGQ